ncbi:MAG: flavin reductase family protein [Chitinophagales bacterium]|nr:flavin reductase family protein [Chitinophagales bacterium]MDW8393815.1 flavin reductase family protein [Chitinophagales bacterium]
MPSSYRMLIVDPAEVPVPRMHGYLLSAVAPRPIAFASTVDAAGNANLSPFSFFNAFGSRPVTLVFSPARRVRDNTVKNTLDNVREVPEVVINVVTYDMVQQANVASSEYPKGIDEFVKAGFSKLPSLRVRPWRVAESPVHMECKVVEIKSMGEQGGGANLVICEVLLMHIADRVLDAQGRIDPHKLDLVARMGQDFYCRASGAALFRVPKPTDQPALGLDGLPEAIRNSVVLSGNDLGLLANVERLPTAEDLQDVTVEPLLDELRRRFGNDAESFQYQCHLAAKRLLAESRVREAWKLLLSG